MKPAWVDREDEIGDDEGVSFQKTIRKAKPDATYESRLVEKFHLVHGPTPEWATVEAPKPNKRAKKDLEDDEGIVPSSKTKYLPRGNLKIFRMLDLNNDGRDGGAIIRSLGFHPSSQVGLVAGSAGVVNLFQVDGVRNTRIQSISFDRFPLRNACFSTSGDEIYASSGLMGHFYCYDMMGGKTTKVKPNRSTEKETIRNLIPSPDQRTLVALGHGGNMYLFSADSKEVIDTLTMSGEVTDVAFDEFGRTMYSTGTDGEIFKWDMTNRVCVEKFNDHGAVSTNKIAVSESFLATGSVTGVVNAYKTESSTKGTRTPEKALMNLVTPVSLLEFNKPGGEILAMGSSDKINGIKLVHLPSLTVFSNFPQLNQELGRINSCAFSPNSGYLSFGNNKGTAYLFRLKHYEEY